MKKALIALSVAAGMIGAAQAENTTTLYGSIGYGTQITKEAGVNNNGLTGAVNTVKDNVWDLDNTTAKFGIKGNEDLSNGIQSFYKLEFGADVNNGINNTRYAYLGLKGAFGTLTLGKQDSLYKTVTNYNDIFQSVYFGNNTVHFGSLSGGGRLGKAISYVSPQYSGFQFGVAGVLDGSHDVVSASDKKSFTAAHAGVWYDNAGFYAGLAYSWLNQDATNYDNFDYKKQKDTKYSRLGDFVAGTPRNAKGNVEYSKGSQEVYGAAVGYSNDQFRVGLGAEVASSVGKVYNLAGEYYYGPSTFRAGFGLADLNEEYSKDKIFTYALGYQYNFSKRTYTWVEGEYVDWNNDDIKNGYTVNVGVRHDF